MSAPIRRQAGGAVGAAGAAPDGVVRPTARPPRQSSLTFAMAILFMVLVFWRPQDWLVPWLYGWRLLEAIVAIAVLVLFLEARRGRISLPRTPAVALVCGLYLSTILSHIPHTYFQGIMDTIPDSFKPCFFTLLLLVVLKTVKQARMVAVVFVVMSCFMAVHALLQQHTGRGFGGQAPMMIFTPQRGWYSRSLFFGIFEDPNDLAQILATSIPLTFVISLRRTLFSLVLAVGLSVVLVLGVLSTASRGGMIALLAAGAIMVFLALPPRWMPWLIGIGLLGGLIACAMKLVGVLDASSRERIMFWGYANWAFKSNPIFGIGYNMFWQVAEERAAHNAFVGCYTEIGLVGYWFWFSLLQTGMVGCWRAREVLLRPKTVEQAYLRRLAGLSIAALTAFSAGAYFLSRTFVFPFFFLFALMNIIPILARNLLPPGAAPRVVPNWRDVMLWGTVSTFGSVIYIYVSILLLNR